MNLRNALLGTTAMLGAAALVMPSTASAFDVNINGFFNFNTVFGDLEEKRQADVRSFDFVTDSEIHIQGVNTDDETGIRYGFTVEFETDPQNGVTGDTRNAVIDESWIFIQGGFGDIRLGNEDGASDNMKVGGFSVAAGTGGIDGQGAVGARKINIANTGDSTKVRYTSPVVGGFEFGVSYTPRESTQGNNFALSGGNKNAIEAGLVYRGSFGGLDLVASGILGSWDESNGNDFLGYGAGATIGFAGIRVGGGWFIDDSDAAGGKTKLYNLGVGANLGPASVSVTWNSIYDAPGGVGEEEVLVLSASMGVLPGMSLQGDVAFFDRDIPGSAFGDDGVTGVARLRVNF